MDKKIEQILDTILQGRLISTEDIPNIDLYMDQVTTFMEKHLGLSKRYPDDKIMTKTMVNNYTKNQLLPASNKKKYSKEHIYLLVMIYYYKNMLSMTDIQHLLSPLTEEYFPANDKNGLRLEDIYEHLMSQIENSTGETKDQIMDTLNTSNLLFHGMNMSKEEHSDLSILTFITQLCYDIYVRKQLIERLLDEIYPPENKNTKKEKKNKK